MNRSDRLKSKLREELGSAASMLRYHLSQASNFKKRALQLSALGGGAPGPRKLGDFDFDSLVESVGKGYSNY